MNKRELRKALYNKVLDYEEAIKATIVPVSSSFVEKMVLCATRDQYKNNVYYLDRIRSMNVSELKDVVWFMTGISRQIIESCIEGEIYDNEKPAEYYIKRKELAYEFNLFLSDLIDRYITENIIPNMGEE